MCRGKSKCIQWNGWMRTSRTDFQVINDDVCRRSWSTSGLSQSVWHICMDGYCHFFTMNAFNNQRLRLVLSIPTIGAKKIMTKVWKINGYSKSNTFYIRATNLDEINRTHCWCIFQFLTTPFKDTTVYLQWKVSILKCY